MAFCRKHRDVLLEGELQPLYPHQLYPLVVARNMSKLLAAFYSGLPLRLEETIPLQLILVNGSYNPELLIDLARPLGMVWITVTSCTGDILTHEEVHLGPGLHSVRVPAAAHADIRQQVRQ
jgi:alpha-galactosidase